VDSESSLPTDVEPKRERLEDRYFAASRFLTLARRRSNVLHDIVRHSGEPLGPGAIRHQHRMTADFYFRRRERSRGRGTATDAERRRQLNWDSLWCREHLIKRYRRLVHGRKIRVMCQVPVR